MCWCLRVYWTVLHNLFVRFITNVANSIYNNNWCAACCGRCCCCCCADCQHKYKQTKRVSTILSDVESTVECGFGGERTTATTATLFQNHDYVIVDDSDANYLEIEHRKIETEPYYLIVDRATAEDVLSCRGDGACLVRPYKEMDVSIKYIVSIYAQGQYFHLFIRQIGGKQQYGIGQQKPHERLFSGPSDIIDYYSCNVLQCTNKNCSLSLMLKPIVA